ncbi:hypothetical protein [Acrocarpospora pleiomorpha]|uniref:hypothetical protein n=1 Tax=Acrocarpospora pleiomorpha TaxID=90975 RepID=UPI0012D356E1|nr:hypothetical protein [Acrocarpospora pleiomorpha]
MTGWRRVEVVASAQLRVRVVPVVWCDPKKDVGDDPALLYRPTLFGTPSRPDRAGSFPIGQGPDLQTMLADRIKAAETAVQERVLIAERQAREQMVAADERVQIAERQAKERTAAAEQQLTQLRAQVTQTKADIDKVSDEAERRVKKINNEVQRLRDSYAGARLLNGALLFVVVFLVLALIFREVGT